MRPDTAERRPRRWGGAPDEAAGGGNVSAIVTASAWRCWTWRVQHACGCGRVADCILARPLPLHADAAAVR